MNPKELPIYDVRDAVLAALRDAKRLILQAPTGSGKSTQVPQMILDAGLAGDGEIVVLQPRRLAARVLAKRVAEERGETPGQTVGYEVRFERAVSKHTRIRFVTEGVLLREMLEEPELPGVAAVLFDEFHERHLYGDLSLALAKKLQETSRPDLLIGVMSATLLGSSKEGGISLEEYLQGAGMVVSEGRMFPVTVEYLDKPSRLEPWEAAAEAWWEQAKKGIEGDVLIFMPGAYEIEQTLRLIREFPQSDGWELHGLHGEMPPDKQDAALRRYDGPKVIVSTNVAETSLTIDGVRLVIDSGLARMARFDPHRGFDALTIEKVSQASAEQRKGRAGRTAPGRCLRLWTALEHGHRPAAELPEIKRVDLAEVLLTMHGLGIDDVRTFPWFEAPLEHSLERAETLLADLGALEEIQNPKSKTQNAITPMGRRMLRFPVHPRFSRMLIEAGARNCVEPVALIAALSQGKSILLRKMGKQVEEMREDLFGDDGTSDFFREIRAFRYALGQEFRPQACQKLGIHAATARQVARLADRFVDIAKRRLNLEAVNPKSPGPDGDDNAISVRKCVLAGFADQVGRRMDGGTLRCMLVHKRRGEIERSSVVRESPFIVAAEIQEFEKATGDLDVLLRRVTAIEPEWLKEMFPHDWKEQEGVFFDSSTRRVQAASETVFRDLVINSKATGEPPKEEAARLLADEVEAGTCPLKNWNDEVETWIARLNCLAAWYPEGGLQPIGKEERRNLVEQICWGAVGYKDIKERPVLPVVRSWLSEPQQLMLDQMVPERWKMPDNRRLKIRYQEGKAPVLAAKIQDFYGVKEHPTLVDGRVPLVLEILAPNMRPIQVTQDLPSFWSGMYLKLKPELARRYPKHKWI